MLHGYSFACFARSLLWCWAGFLSGCWRFSVLFWKPFLIYTLKEKAPSRADLFREHCTAGWTAKLSGSADPRVGRTSPGLCEASSHRPWEACSVVSPVRPASVSALSSQAASHLLNSREGSRLGPWRPEIAFWNCSKLALCLVGSSISFLSLRPSL